MEIKTTNQDIQSLIELISVSTEQTFADRCVAVYLMGSLARGGFSELASDIDLGIIVAGPLQEGDAALVGDIQAKALAEYPGVKNNVSIFWGSIESINGVVDAGRYPPFDRLDLIDHALLLAGTDVRNQLVKPSQQELEVAGAEFALDYLGSEQRRQEFFDCGRIAEQGLVYVTKTILFPARFIYLVDNGLISGNEASYWYYVEQFSGADAALVEAGYQWRLQSLPEDIDEVTERLNQGLRALYHQFIDIYCRRMQAYGEFDLEARLLEWKKAISRPV